MLIECFFIFLSLWFLGNLTRSQAEERLLAPGMPPGSFLVRKSQSKAGFALSVGTEDQVVHYHIGTVWSEKGTFFYIAPGSRFPSLAKLVQHYRNNTGGLRCILTYACRRAEQLVASGTFLQIKRRVRAKDAQTKPIETKLSSSLGASQKQAEGKRQKS